MKEAGLEKLIASLAVEAVLHEAITGPKPGLVDRFNSGSHNDMTLFTFCSSASVLHPYFKTMAEKGAHFKGSDYSELLKEIRPVGIEAEDAMFKATGGINTHKGIIFSLGVLSSAAASLNKGERKGESICKRGAEICKGIVERELTGKKTSRTNGEKLYSNSGVTGIRGEAELGFPSVVEYGLPCLRRSRGEWNNRLIDTLLHLMTAVEDTNVLHRGGTEALSMMKNQALQAIRNGGASSHDGQEILKQMDLIFTEQNISPGGCADLLAISIFLFKL